LGKFAVCGQGEKEEPAGSHDLPRTKELEELQLLCAPDGLHTRAYIELTTDMMPLY
jgi:hypothetical protein